MPDNISLSPEQIKSARQAEAVGFLVQARAGLGMSEKQAAAFFRRAIHINNKTKAKVAKVVELVRGHIAAPAA